MLRRRITNNYQNMVQSAARTGYDLAGSRLPPVPAEGRARASSREGLAVLIALVEQEPRWLEYVGQTGWAQNGNLLAQWRYELQTNGGQLGDLDARLLKIVLTELRRDLESQRQYNRSMYWQGDTFFWAAKKQDFIDTAEKVLAERKNSGAAVVYITQYLYHGLGEHGRAVDALLDAHRREVLDEAGQSQLVQFAEEQSRFAETIPVLEPLVQRRPDNVQYRVWLMRAYWGTKQQAKLLDLLKKTDAYFHEQNRWQEPVMAALAHSCLENGLYEQSAAYYKEAISLHQRTQPGRGIGDGTLANYYADQARAYGGLGKTAEAVDAACGAVVSWGRDIGNRANALSSLREALKAAPDLDAYVVQLDKDAAKNHQDNPVVRKALGQVYLEKGQFDKAIVQLNLAAGLQPNDTEIYKALIDCYDKQQDRHGAIREILRSLELSRRDIERYRDLGNRLEKIGRRDESERAFTSIVEVLPHESEGQAMLAEVRQGQNRWADAIVHWEQVARIRALEPTGLLKLAAAQIHEKRWSDAAETLDKLRSRPWPTRFGDVPGQVRNLEQQVERKGK
jgi:tetratricopeptide (TPR) repeat protein